METESILLLFGNKTTKIYFQTTNPGKQVLQESVEEMI